MDLIYAFLLGVIQGITEWLPISSSGHLAIFQLFFNIKTNVFFDIMLHIGTLIAVIAVFWKKIIKLTKAFFTFKFKTKNEKMSLFLIIASIPTALIGFSFQKLFESFFLNSFVIGFAFILTGALLFLTKFAESKKKMSWLDSIVIGIAQGIAIIPGISRSGSTISTAMLLGIDKNEAAEFSFLLFIPAIIGAFIFKAKQVGLFFSIDIIVGIFTSAVVGFLTIKYLIDLIKRGKFYYFSYYCLALGLFLILSQQLI